MKFQLKKGEQSVILTVFIQDSSATDGRGLGSLDKDSSIVGGYVKRNGTGVALAVDDDVVTPGTWVIPSEAGKVKIGTPANMTTGTYELHFHNDLFTTADWVTITLGGAENMAPLPIEVQLTDFDLNTALTDATIVTAMQAVAADFKATGFSTHDAAAVVTALLADATIGAAGTATFAEIIRDIFAFSRGQYAITESGDTVTITYKDDDNATTVFTIAATKTGRTVS